MVAYENAVALSQNNFDCYTLCLENSPLEQHLRALDLPVVTLKRGFFSFLKVRRFIKAQGIKIVLIQVLKDLKLISLAAFLQPELKIFAISHIFVGVNKKDFVHRWSYGKLQKLICLTKPHKQNLLKYLPLRENQIEIIPNFVDCERFHPGNRSDEVRKSLGAVPEVPLVGIASRLDPQKGQSTALEALQILKKKQVPVRMVIVGENTLHEMDYLSVLKKMAIDLDVADRVHFTGYRADMDKIIASLDALIMPSHRETFGRVLIEAMASKTPVIATNAGGVPDIIDTDHNGLLVAPQNAEELAGAIERLVTQPELHLRLAEAGYSTVRANYAKNIVEKKLLDLLSV